MPDSILWPAPDPAEDFTAEDSPATPQNHQLSTPLFPHLPAIPLDALRLTFDDLGAALSTAPDLVALVGVQGSGKTYALRSMHLPLDRTDNADAKTLRTLAASSACAGRLAALRPEDLPTLRRCFPAAAIVRMRSIGAADATALLDARRQSLHLPPDAFTPKAASLLAMLCGGNPGRLDRLACASIRAARKTHTPHIGAAHVEQAARELEKHKTRPRLTTVLAIIAAIISH